MRRRTHNWVVKVETVLRIRKSSFKRNPGHLTLHVLSALVSVPKFGCEVAFDSGIACSIGCDMRWDSRSVLSIDRSANSAN